VFDLFSSVRAVPGQKKNTATRFARDCAFSNPPLHRLGFPKKSGEVGEDCLSAQREFRSRPIFSEIRGKPEGPVRWGALLFGTFILGKQNKGTSRRAAPGYQSFARSAPTLGFAGSAQPTDWVHVVKHFGYRGIL
jgi:hypothetical protein